MAKRVINRTDRDLISFWDSREYVVPASGSAVFSDEVADKFVSDHCRRNYPDIERGPQGQTVEKGSVAPVQWVEVVPVEAVYAEAGRKAVWTEDGIEFESQAAWMDYIRAKALERAKAETAAQREAQAQAASEKALAGAGAGAGSGPGTGASAGRK